MTKEARRQPEAMTTLDLVLTRNIYWWSESYVNLEGKWLCYLKFNFSKEKKTEHHALDTLDYVNIFKMFREKICIIHGMSLLKRLWLKCVMFSKMQFRVQLQIIKRGGKWKENFKKCIWRYFKMKKIQLKSIHVYLIHHLGNAVPRT